MTTSVKTAISMQKDLFQKVNVLADELQVSRSRLFVMAVQNFIKQNESKKMLSKINRAFSDYPDSEEKRVHSKMSEKQFNNLERESW